MFNILKQNTLLILIIALGTILRFYNINWGAPFYFHPDERNIASAVSNLKFPLQMNPHFFAYGSFPIYAIYFLGIVWNFLFQTINQISQEITKVSFENAIIISRFYSAFFGALLLLLVYKIGKLLKDEKLGMLALFLASFSVGFIQYAHFGTFETWLTFFGTLLFYLSLKYLKTKKQRYFIFVSILIGLLVSIKISAIVLFLIPLIILIKQNKKIKNILLSLSLLGFFSFLIYFSTSPYTFFDFQSFKSSIDYESSVATGSLLTFYTQGFLNTTPVLFQLTKVFPFLINPLFTLILIPTLIYFVYLIIKKRNFSYLLLFSFFIILFLSQAILFVKWARYMLPTLPFIYLILGISLLNFFQFIKKKNIKLYQYTSISILSFITLINVIYVFSYFKTALIEKDSRFQALYFAQNHIPSNAKILSEVYDLGILPFNNYFKNIKLENTYELENDLVLNGELNSNLLSYDYIILPSQRVLRSRFSNSQQFPKSYKFYNNLIAEKEFKKIYQTPCDLFCKIIYMEDPIFNVEETINVFDRPTVFIFKKIK